jgi:hypothetical protein
MAGAVPFDSDSGFPPKNSHTYASIEQCRNSILKDTSGLFGQNSAGIPLPTFPFRREARPSSISLQADTSGLLAMNNAAIGLPKIDSIHPFPPGAGHGGPAIRAPLWRITIGVAEVASEASNLSEARRGARFFFSFPARIRASELMERSEMVRERARTEHRRRIAEERSGYV